MAHRGFKRGDTNSQTQTQTQTQRIGSDLEARVSAKLLESQITAADAERLGIRAMTEKEYAALPNMPPSTFPGFQIPYHDILGRPTGFFRFRHLPSSKGFGALVTELPRKYVQPIGTSPQVYFSPLLDWKPILSDVRTPIWITEGELKAACASKNELPTIGIGGVDSFADRKNGDSLLPDLLAIDWNGRDTYIAYDSDAARNPAVRRAEARLAEELTALRARPRVIRLPDLEGLKKTGLDDFLVKVGRAGLVELIESVPLFHQARALYELASEILFIEEPDIFYALEKDIRMSAGSFKNSRYANKHFLKEVGANKDGSTRMEKASAAAAFIEWEARPQVHSFTYRPGQPKDVIEQVSRTGIAKTAYNLWQPWPYEPSPGDVSPWREMLDHLFGSSSEDSETEQARRWFEQWVAYPMQHPGAKLKQAVLFWGGQGSGKSFTAETIMRIYGEYNSTKFDNSALTSRFNTWAAHRQFAVGEEIVVSAEEKRSISERLKQLITDYDITIEEKGLNCYTLPNCMNLLFISNHAGALQLEPDDRRMFVKHVTSGRLPEKLRERFHAFSWSPEGLSALFHYFLHLDLTGFNPEAEAMSTFDKRVMIGNSASEHLAWLAELREYPEAVLRIGEASVPYSLYTSEDIFNIYRASHEHTRINAVTVGMAMAQLNFVRPYRGVVRVNAGAAAKNLWMLRPVEGLETMGPNEIGRYYDAERKPGAAFAKKRFAKETKK